MCSGCGYYMFCDTLLETVLETELLTVRELENVGLLVTGLETVL